MSVRKPRSRRNVTAVVNQKGGVGKTTVTLLLASAARAAGLKTLVIDADPGGGSTFALGVDLDDSPGNLNDALYDGSRGCAYGAVNDTAWGDLIKCIPAVEDLQARTLENDAKAPHRLLTALDDDEAADFDLILIDTRPAMDSLLTNSLIAARHYVVVGEAAAFSNRAFASLMDNIETVQAFYNPDLSPAGVVLNKVNKVAGGNDGKVRYTREAEHRILELEEAFGDDLVWRPLLPSRVALSEAAGAQTPLHEHVPSYNDLPQIADRYLQNLLEAMKDKT